MIISFHFTVLSMGDVKLSFLDFLIDSAVRRLSFEIWIYTFLGKFNRIFGLSVESCKKGCKFVPFWGHFWYFILFSFAFYLIFSYSATKSKKLQLRALLTSNRVLSVTICHELSITPDSCHHLWTTPYLNSHFAHVS